jgi:hypothetical protein
VDCFYKIFRAIHNAYIGYISNPFSDYSNSNHHELIASNSNSNGIGSGSANGTGTGTGASGNGGHFFAPPIKSVKFEKAIDLIGRRVAETS